MAAVVLLGGSAIACSVLSGLDEFELSPSGSGGGGSGPGSGGTGGLGGNTSGPGGSGGGTGGAGGLGGAGGFGGMGPEVIDAWTAGPPQADGTYALPGWLKLTSPSSDKTVQDSSSTLRTGFGPDAARARRVATGWGLTVESQRTNRAHYAKISVPEWSLNAVALASVLGPDGAPTAASLSDGDAAVAASAYSAMTGDNMTPIATLSAWVADVSAANPAFIGSSRLTGQGTTVPTHAGWARYSFTAQENTQPTAHVQTYPAYGLPAPSGVGASSFDFVSFETGKYPSSVIITNGAPVTRMAESLKAINNTPKDLAPAGQFHVRLVFAPAYASGEMSADHDLIFFDAADRITLRTDGTVAVLMGGTQVLASDPIDLSREEALTIDVASTAAGVSLAVTDDSGTDMKSAAAVAPLAPAGDIYVLGSDTGSQECADLRSITFYAPR